MDENLNKQIELCDQTKQYFLKKKNDLRILGEYITLLAKFEHIPFTEEEKKQILEFYQNTKDPFVQEELFIYWEYGKHFKFLNLTNCTNNFFKNIKAKPFSLLNSLYQAKQEINQEHLAEIIDEHNFKNLIIFNNLWARFLNNHLKNNFPSKLIDIFEKLSKQGFKSYQEYLEYLLQISFTINLDEKSIELRSSLIKTKKKNFSSPLDTKRLELQKKKEEYENAKGKKKKLKQNQNLIDKIIHQHENSFIFLTAQTKIHLKDQLLEALPKIIAHNETILLAYEEKIKKLKREIEDEYLLLFLDFDLPLPTNETLKEIKKSTNIEELKKILKVLTKKEYSFLTPNHPDYLDTIQNTSSKTLKEISKEIQEKRLLANYINRYPKLLCIQNWEQYKQNKNLILQQNLELSFFQNSEVLLYSSEKLLQIINLIKAYHCSQLPLFHLAYFDEVDELIENRFDSNLNPLDIQNNSTLEVKKILNNQIPLIFSNVEEEPEIKWLDEQFKIDPLRYFLHGIVISRLKVLRYFKALNEKNEDRKQNLLHAIFYNTPLFEFEIAEITEMLTTKTRQKKNDFLN